VYESHSVTGTVLLPRELQCRRGNAKKTSGAPKLRNLQSQNHPRQRNFSFRAGTSAKKHEGRSSKKAGWRGGELPRRDGEEIAVHGRFVLRSHQTVMPEGK